MFTRSTVLASFLAAASISAGGVILPDGIAPPRQAKRKTRSRTPGPVRPAGAKLAHMAAEQRLTKRHPLGPFGR
jgi:hypothetical protein